MRAQYCTLAVLFTLLIAVSAAADDDMQRAEELRNAAEQGAAAAQLDYAKALQQSGAADEARAWAEKAANQGLAEAWFWLAIQAPAERALPYYEKAAEAGYANAFSPVLEGLLFSAGPAADVPKAKRFADLARKAGAPGITPWEFELVDECDRTGEPRVPEGDRPLPDEIAAFKKGGQECWTYSGAADEAQRDWGKYRKCLLAAEVPENNLLAEVYANGWGVPRNPTLALAFLCRGAAAPDELYRVVKAVMQSRDQAELKEPFRFCSFMRYGYRARECAARAEKIAAAKRAAALARAEQGWTPAQKAAFGRLRQAAAGFFAARAGGEQELWGSGQAENALSERTALEDQFLKDIQACEAGRLPEKADFAAAEKELNQLYNGVLEQPVLEDFGSVPKEGVRKTQAQWLPYRDAWAAFGTARYPQIAKDTWLAWVTKQRIAQLEKLRHG